MKAGALLFLLLVWSQVHAQQARSSYYLHQLQVLLEQEHYKDAEKYADSLLRVVLKSGNPDSISIAYSWQYEVHLAGKEFEKALNDFRMVSKLRDSVSSHTNATTVNHMANAMKILRESQQTDSLRLTGEINTLRERSEQDHRSQLILLVSTLAFAGIGVLIFYRKSRQAYQIAEGTQKSLEELQAFRQKLFTVLSYDLKNSLSSFENITRSFEAQIGSLGKEEAVQFLIILHTTAAELKGTLDNVLHWVGYQVNARPFLPASFFCRELAEQVLAKFKGPLTIKSMAAEVFMPEGQQVFADREMTEIILDNLISNAIHFTPPGGAITLFSGGKDGLVMMGIRDTGKGIKKEDSERLFKIKEDVRPAGSSGNKGAGIGLILCRELVERNGGRIYVESEVGKGSTFYFTLPEKKM